ncbi:nitrate/nitrite transporter [Salinifilum aidingensis]
MATDAVRAIGRWREGWDPEDRAFWERTGRRVARRNLVLSIFAEHVGFSVWNFWSVLVLFLSPDIGFDFTAGEKFLLGVLPTLVGAVLRLPYSAAVTRFGGRTWTTIASALLLVPTLAAAVLVHHPGAPLWVFVLVGATSGVGGATFASSMTNIAAFYPRSEQGWTLGLNAGGGNIGVATMQLIGLLIIATAGDAHPAYVCVVYLPLIVLAALGAALGMDDIDAVRARPGAQVEAVRERHTWLLSLLYVGTFGSFIGYSFAFGLVLQTEFGFGALQAASYTFLGPLLGSLSRPVGGRLADVIGGARLTLANFLGMAAGTAVLLHASAVASFPLYLAAFIALFVLTGVGNGAVTTMIPAVFAEQAASAVAAGADPGTARERSRRVSGAVISITGALGALGGVFINLAFRASYGGPAGDGDTALLVFLAFYVCCALLIWAVYLRRSRGLSDASCTGTPANARSEVEHV